MTAVNVPADASRLMRWSCGLLVVTAVSSLAGRLLALPVLAGATPGHIPMAPTTACAFILLAAALHPDLPWTRFRRSRVGLLLLVILLVFPSLARFPSVLLQGGWGAVAAARLHTNWAEVWTMSPVTGTFFLLIAVPAAIQGVRAPAAGSRLRAWSATLLAVASCIILIGYLHDAPLFYGGLIVPVALLSACNFLVIAIAVIIEAGAGVWPWKLLAGNSSRAVMLRAFLPLSFGIAVGIGFSDTLVDDSEHRVLGAAFLVGYLFLTVWLVLKVSTRVSANLDAALQDLSDSQALLASVVESIPLMIFLKEAKDLRFIAFNRAGEELVGHDRRGLLGKNDQDLFPPEQAARFVAADREVLDGEAGMLDVPEEPLSTAKKGTRLLHTRKVRIRGADGTAKYLLGISEDITDRVEAATALQRQNGLLTTLLEVLPVGVMMVEAPSGKPLVVNEEARKLLGRGILSHASRENLGSVYEAFKEGSHDPYPENEMPLVRGLNGESAHVDDMIILRPDGTKTLLEVFGSPLRNPQGQVWASLVHFTDITVRRQEEKERHDSQQMSSNTLNSIRDHIIILDIRSHRILEANAAFLSDCGLTRQQVLGRTCYDVTHGLSVPCSAPDDHCPIEDMLASRTHVKTEHVHRSANGQERIVEVSVHPITNLDGTIHRVVHVSRDITDNKDKERTHIQLQKLESLGVLAGGIAHDFNNILTTILANISLLQSRGAVSGESLEWIEEAQAACGTAQGLARQLLTFAKGGSPVVEVVDLRPVLMQAAAFATRGSNARCIFDLGEDPLATSIDVDQVTQVVQNLVLNASQATPQGGDITIRARTADLGEREQVPLPAGCYILVSVADRGVGIAPEILSKVFDPYFSTKGVGRGLGLSACHSIMLRHGGIIRAESTLGVGAVFTLYFPAQASADIVREPVTPMLVVGSGRVLVMDDEASLAKVLRRLLTSLGYTADSVADGQAALDAYKAAMSSDNPYDAVILDLTIPGGLGGEETIAKLLELDPKVKAVVSSGYSDSTVVAESGKHGFLGTLAKPYGVADVSEVMRRLFESRTVT